VTGGSVLSAVKTGSLTIATPNFARNRENGIKTKWGSLLQTLVGIVGRVKERDK
jgi:hypothetical protein